MPTKWNPLPIEEGGTGGTTPASARRALGLGSLIGAALYFAATKIADWTASVFNLRVILNFPGAGQSFGITWNTSDIHLFRQGAGRLAIQLGAASGNDTAIDITNVNTVEEGSTRLRIWAYDLNAVTDQSFLEIRNVRDVGTESMQYNSESQGSGIIRDQVWLFGGVEAMRLKTNKTLVLSAGATSGASLRIPHGAAPTSPVNGDVWTTTAGLFVRINGATIGPLS